MAEGKIQQSIIILNELRYVLLIKISRHVNDRVNGPSVFIGDENQVTFPNGNLVLTFHLTMWQKICVQFGYVPQSIRLNSPYNRLPNPNTLILSRGRSTKTIITDDYSVNSHKS